MGAAEQPFSRRVVVRKMMTMTAILLVFLQCLVIQQYHNKNNGLFVAGFATSKQTDVHSSSPYHTFPSLETPTAIATNCRMHKTRLWFGNNNNNNNDEEDDAGINYFFTSGGDDSSRGIKKKRVAVSVDVNVKIARDKKTTEETSYYDIREEMTQEFYQKEEVIDSFAATYDDDRSPSDEIMMAFPEVFEDFNNDDSNYYFIVAEDYEQEETSSVEEYCMSDYEQEETSVEEYYMSEIPPPSSLLKAIEPTKDKPTKKFVSPIQFLKQA